MIPLLLAACAASAADTGKPAANLCDLSAIPPDAPRKTVISPNKGPRWTALGMDSGGAVCLYSSRFVVFRENYQEFKGADADDMLKTYFARGNEHITYIFSPQKLLSFVSPYRGEAASRLYAVRAVYGDSTRASLLRADIRGGGDFDKNWKYFRKTSLAKHWLWENPKARAKLNKWLASEISAKRSAPPDCVPAAEILTAVPESYLSGYRAEKAKNRKVKAVSAKYQIVVARAVCAGHEDEPRGMDRKKLALDSLLEAMR